MAGKFCLLMRINKRNLKRKKNLRGLHSGSCFVGWVSKSFFTNAFNNRYCNRKNTLLFILFKVKLPFLPSTFPFSSSILKASGNKGALYVRVSTKKKLPAQSACGRGTLFQFQYFVVFKFMRKISIIFKMILNRRQKSACTNVEFVGAVTGSDRRTWYHSTNL